MQCTRNRIVGWDRAWLPRVVPMRFWFEGYVCRVGSPTLKAASSNYDKRLGRCVTLATSSITKHTCALQQSLGHRNIQHTVCYAELTPQRFQNFWED